VAWSCAAPSARATSAEAARTARFLRREEAEAEAEGSTAQSAAPEAASSATSTTWEAEAAPRNARVEAAPPSARAEAARSYAREERRARRDSGVRATSARWPSAYSAAGAEPSTRAGSGGLRLSPKAVGPSSRENRRYRGRNPSGRSLRSREITLAGSPLPSTAHPRRASRALNRFAARRQNASRMARIPLRATA